MLQYERGNAQELMSTSSIPILLAPLGSGWLVLCILEWRALQIVCKDEWRLPVLVGCKGHQWL